MPSIRMMKIPTGNVYECLYHGRSKDNHYSDLGLLHRIWVRFEQDGFAEDEDTAPEFITVTIEPTE